MMAWGLGLVLVWASAAAGQPPAERSRLIAHFQLDGMPHPVSLTVATERFRRTFRDVDYIDEAVPSEATYTLATAIPGGNGRDGVTFKDVIPNLRLPPGQTVEIIVHLVAGGRLDSFDSVVLVEEVGAGALVRNTIEGDPRRPGRFTLRSELQGTAGTRVILDTILEPLDSRQGFLCQAPCPHALPVDCTVHCFTCSTTASLEGNVWKTNYNMCDITLDAGGTDVASTFEPVPPNFGGVVLNAALRDDAIVRPLSTSLTDLRSDSTIRLEPPFPSRSFPDFVVRAGFHTYRATFPGRRGAPRDQTFALPVVVADGEILPLFLVLPSPDDLRPFAASILGDSRLGLAAAGIRSSTGRGSTVVVDVEMDDRGDGVAWILVPFPQNQSVAEVRKLPPGAPPDGDVGEGLTERRDFMVGPLDDRSALVFRTGERSARYRVTFAR